MDAEVNRLTEKLHACGTMAVIVVAGAGTQSTSWLLQVPGASRTVLEILVPYASASLVEYLGHEPAQSVSAETAEQMARLAYRRAVRLRPGNEHVAGVASTASIASDRPKRGDHRCHVCAWDATGATSYSLTLTKGLRDRAGEDRVVSLLVMRALAEAGGVSFDLPLELRDDERVEVSRVSYVDGVEALIADHVSTATLEGDGRVAADEPVSGAVLAGSFNPLHEGHRQLAEAASKILGANVTFELSVTNVDKPPLAESEVRARASQFRGIGPSVLTRAPVFFEKARLFPGGTFVVGWDTMARLVDPKYYCGSSTRMLLALEEMRGLGCSFLVAGRADGAEFHTLDDVAVPAGFEGMFRSIPESAFRYDVSSTELRGTSRSPGPARSKGKA